MLRVTFALTIFSPHKTVYFITGRNMTKFNCHFYCAGERFND